jgi:tRNA dimethylallyltransferase
VKSRALLIHGPTASGKSALALALARRLDGEIINADALQVYADLRVLTARPDDADLAAAPHRLYGDVDAAERFSVGKWQARAMDLVQDCLAAGRVPIIVGGTGLAFSALTEGLANIPAIPADIREEAQRRVIANPEAALTELIKVDPVAGARLFPADHVRVTRALEVFAATGRSLTDWQAETLPALQAGEWLGVALNPPRAELYRTIDARFGQMLAKGALEEAEVLWKRGLPRDLPAMKAHGMPWLGAHFDGEITLEEATTMACRDTRHYAKRQYTWLNGRGALWPKLEEISVEARTAVVLALWRGLDLRQEND